MTARFRNATLSFIFILGAPGAALADVGEAVLDLLDAAVGDHCAQLLAVQRLRVAVGLAAEPSPCTARGSLTAAGGPADGTNRDPELSADGLRLVFRSNGSLVAGTTGRSHVYLRDFDALFTEILDPGVNGGESDDTGGDLPDVSGDGLHVAFQSTSDNLVEPITDNGNLIEVYVRDIEAGASVRASVTMLGGRGVGTNAAINFNGRFVAFASTDPGYVPNDTNTASQDIFVLDRDSDDNQVYDELGGTEMRRASVQTGGAQAAGGSSDDPRLTSDGRQVVFASSMTNLVPGDTNARGDIFVHDLDTTTTTLVSRTADGGLGDQDCGSPSISASGRFVAFHSAAAFTPEAANGTQEVFLRDRDADEDGVFDEPGEVETILVSRNGDDLPGDDDDYNARVTADGAYVFFYSLSKNLISSDADDASDVYVYEVATAALALASVRSDGTPVEDDGGDGGLIRTLSPSANGRFFAFMSASPTIAPSPPSPLGGVFVRDRDVTEDL